MTFSLLLSEYIVIKIPSAANAAEGIFFQPSTASRCMADFESAVNPEIQISFKKKRLRLIFIS